MPKTNPTTSQERETISVQDLLDTGYYLNPQNANVIEVFKVADALDKWLAEVDAGTAQVSVGISAHCIVLSIGDHVVWDSECDSEQVLTPTACIANYRNHVTQLFEPFRDDPENN